MDIESFESTLTDVEIVFNKLGAVPVIGLFSGAARTVAAKVQLAVASVFLVVGLVGLCFSSAQEPNTRVHIGLNHIGHGALNYLRGVTESVAGSLIVGSIVILAVHIFRQTEANQSAFRPFFKYNTIAAL